MRLASVVNQYVSEQAPWALMDDDRDRAGTVLYAVLRSIDNLKLLFTPFLPFSSQTLHELLGYEDVIAGPLRFEEVEEEGGAPHVVLTGDYHAWSGRWEPTELTAGQGASRALSQARSRTDRSGRAGANAAAAA